MLTWLKKIWKAYFPISKWGLCGSKLRQPATLSEALYALDKILSNDAKDLFQNLAEQDIVTSSHHSLGRWMRNDWGLWNIHSPLHKWFTDRGVWHPDDMSSIIIRSYYRRLKGEPIKFREQIQHFVEYWKAQDVKG